MLGKVKSVYFVKKLFLNVDETKKLKIVKYNKILQNNIDINIINYKIFKNKYIIFEKNGIGKEFNNRDKYRIYEGEYLNGERHGKGKGYANDNLIFEGEYLKGKKMEK